MTLENSDHDTPILASDAGAPGPKETIGKTHSSDGTGLRGGSSSDDSAKNAAPAKPRTAAKRKLATNPKPSADVDGGIGATPHQERWMLITGVAFLGVSLLFFMGLVLLCVVGKFTIGADARFPIVCVLSITVAAGAAFMGGYATARGNIDWLQGKKPLQISIGGGVAVFFLCLLLGWKFYVEPGFEAETRRELYKKGIPELSPQQEQVNELRRQAIELRGPWEAIETAPLKELNRVQDGAINIYNQLQAVKGDLGSGYNIDRAQYSGYVTIMAADALFRRAQREPNSQKLLRDRDIWIDKGIKALNEAEDAVSKLKQEIDVPSSSLSVDDLKRERDTMEFVIKFDDEARIQALLAQHFSLDYFGRKLKSRREIMEMFERIPNSSLENLGIDPDSYYYYENVLRDDKPKFLLPKT